MCIFNHCQDTNTQTHKHTPARRRRPLLKVLHSLAFDGCSFQPGAPGGQRSFHSEWVRERVRAGERGRNGKVVSRSGMLLFRLYLERLECLSANQTPSFLESRVFHRGAAWKQSSALRKCRNFIFYRLQPKNKEIIPGAQRLLLWFPLWRFQREKCIMAHFPSGIKSRNFPGIFSLQNAPSVTWRREFPMSCFSFFFKLFLRCENGVLV